MKHSTGTSTTTKRAALTLVGAGALAASLGLGGLAHAAGPSQTGARPVTQGIVWLDDLLHPIDIADAFRVFGTVRSRVGPGDGAYSLSACTGETRMRDVVGDDANLFHGVFTGKNGDTGVTFTMPQHVADQATVAQATTTYNRIVRMVSACQQVPAGHWYYGVAHSSSNSFGSSTWMIGFTGDGVRDGGVVMARVGRHLAVTEVDGATTSHQMWGLVAGTVTQLR